MTPEQRLKRAERLILILTRAGRRARQEWGEKVNILIHAQIQADDRIKNLAESQQSLAESQQSLAESQKLTDQTLRAFINSLRKDDNGKTSG
jgi:hypothetical protein